MKGANILLSHGCELVTPFWTSNFSPVLRLAQARVNRLPTPDPLAKMSIVHMGSV
jgi:hypothetical protein